jgi:hypothetical protein
VRWRRDPEVLWRAVPGYLVLATLDGRVTEATGPAGEAWRRLEQWTEEAQLTKELSRQFGADEVAVARDLRTLLHQLDEQGLVHACD